jgi:quercetin dioxygenase-like cupin family protein
MRRLLRRVAPMLLVGCLALPATSMLAQTPDKKPAPPPPPPKAAPSHVIVDAAQLKWMPAPPSLPPGGQMAVLDGDPTKSGGFSMRVKLPDGFVVPPHWHPTAENLVVLSGTLMMGVGDKVDDASMHALTAGGYARMPAKVHHYVRTKGETTFQVYGTGPFAITYVNPKDDPRTNKKTTP